MGYMLVSHYHTVNCTITDRDRIFAKPTIYDIITDDWFMVVQCMCMMVQYAVLLTKTYQLFIYVNPTVVQSYKALFTSKCCSASISG